MIRTERCLLMAAAAVLIASGCGGPSSQNPFKPGAGGPRPASRVEVTNNNWLDAVVHATRLGSRVRIGEVTGLSQRTLDIPAGFIGADGTVGLQVTLVGSAEHFQTDDLRVLGGETIVLTIQNQIATSSWGIFRR